MPEQHHPHSEFDNQAPNAGIPNQLNVFWEGRTGTEFLTDGNKHVSATVFFHERLAELKPDKNRSKERNERVMRFRTWIPFSEGEMNMAFDGSAQRVQRAHNTKNGLPKRAVENTYKTMVGYLQDSYKQLDLLESALITPEDADSAIDHHAMKKLIAQNGQFRGLFANYFYSKERLDCYDKELPKNRKAFFHGAVIAAAQYASDQTLESMFEHLYSHARHRQHFWSSQIAKVEDLEPVKAILADTEFIPPSKIRRRSSPVESASEAEEQLPAKTGEIVIKNSFEELVPPEAVRELTSHEEGRVDNLMHQHGISQEQAMQQVLGIKTADEIEKKELGQDAKARWQAKIEGGSHPTGLRGKKYHFDNDNARVDSDRDPY